MKGLHRVAQDCLLAQKRYSEAETLTDEEALEILADWDVEILKRFYANDRISLEEFEAILDHQMPKERNI